nr:hypothetical protein [Nostoc commune]
MRQLSDRTTKIYGVAESKYESCDRCNPTSAAHVEWHGTILEIM